MDPGHAGSGARLRQAGGAIPERVGGRVVKRYVGKELVIGDLQNYIAIALSSNLPVIIPTQRHIKPSEVAIVWDTGIKGLMLTRVVLGETAKTLEKAVREYRIAIDDLG